MFKITWDKENNGVLLTMRSTFMGLDNINLREDLSSLDILKMLL